MFIRRTHKRDWVKWSLIRTQSQIWHEVKWDKDIRKWDSPLSLAQQNAASNAISSLGITDVGRSLKTMPPFSFIKHNVIKRRG